jgi:tRNA 2-thiouridine synthesizing protein C
MNMPSRELLLVCRHSPYGSQLSRSALDIALAASVFERDLSVLFMDEGVWQLLREQDAGSIYFKSIEKIIDSFPLYDLDSLFVDQHSLTQRQLSQSAIRDQVQLLGAQELPTFLNSFKQIISC